MERCGNPACRRLSRSRLRLGLCRACYFDPATRDACGVRKKRQLPEPTDAELDALVAERLRPENLPAWWQLETDRMRQREIERGTREKEEA